MRQQMLQQQQQEWMQQQYLLQQQQQQQQQQMLQAQPTGYGSNNPFGPGPSAQPQQASPQPPMPAFLPTPQISSPAPAPTLQPQLTAQPPKQAQRPQKDDGENAKLAALLANGREDGMDTFGNVGALRKSS